MLFFKFNFVIHGLVHSTVNKNGIFFFGHFFSLSVTRIIPSALVGLLNHRCLPVIITYCKMSYFNHNTLHNPVAVAYTKGGGPNMATTHPFKQNLFRRLPY